MAKKKSTKGEVSKKEKAPVTAHTGPESKPIIRAIRVTEDVLSAAKAYKKAKGISFYQLGHNAISEVLTREGFLKAAEPKA